MEPALDNEMEHLLFKYPLDVTAINILFQFYMLYLQVEVYLIASFLGNRRFIFLL